MHATNECAFSKEWIVSCGGVPQQHVREGTCACWHDPAPAACASQAHAHLAVCACRARVSAVVPALQRRRQSRPWVGHTALGTTLPGSSKCSKCVHSACPAQARAQSARALCHRPLPCACAPPLPSSSTGSKRARSAAGLCPARVPLPRRTTTRTGLDKR